MTLDQLLGELSPAVFYEKYFTRLPHAIPNGARRLANQLTQKVVSELFASNHPNVLYAKGGRAADGEPNPADAARLFSGGHTVVFRHAERSHATLRQVAEDFTRNFKSAVDVQVFWSPPQQEGFSWHYDVEDVFIVQCHGSKEFHLRKNTVSPYPTDKSTGGQDAYSLESSPMLIRCLVEPGDWLYIPSGYWHRAQPKSESVHLSIGITPRTMSDLVDDAAEESLSSAAWRERLPDYSDPRCSLPELRACYAKMVTRLRTSHGDSVADRVAERSTAIIDLHAQTSVAIFQKARGFTGPKPDGSADAPVVGPRPPTNS